MLKNLTIVFLGTLLIGVVYRSLFGCCFTGKAMRKITSMKILVAFCFLLLIPLFLISTATPAIIRTVEGVVIAVSDGDTFKLETVEGTKLKVRLYGIDAPETEKINRRTGMISKQGQPYGEEAFKSIEVNNIGQKSKGRYYRYRQV